MSPYQLFKTFQRLLFEKIQPEVNSQTRRMSIPALSVQKILVDYGREAKGIRARTDVANKFQTLRLTATDASDIPAEGNRPACGPYRILFLAVDHNVIGNIAFISKHETPPE